MIIHDQSPTTKQAGVKIGSNESQATNAHKEYNEDLCVQREEVIKRNTTKDDINEQHLRIRECHRRLVDLRTDDPRMNPSSLRRLFT